MDRRYAVIVEPEFAASDRAWIEALRRRHDPVGQARVGPHITVFFAAAFADAARLAAAMTRSAAAAEPFAVELGGVLVLDDVAGGAVVCLGAGRGRAECLALHDRVYAGDLAHHLRADIPYEPHLTLGRRPERASAEALAGEIAAEPRLIPGRIDALRLVELGAAAAIRRLVLPLGRRPAGGARS
jgi:2'-5' RNA ligase